MFLPLITVFTAPPKIVQVTVDRRMLKLEWVSLLEELAEHMVYEIRYAAEDTLNWKVMCRWGA